RPPPTSPLFPYTTLFRSHLRPQRADVDQLVEVERFLRELADRDQRSVDADRAHRDVDARAVEQARIAQRMRLVDAAADRGDDLRSEEHTSELQSPYDLVC